jgi:hypothetical protein
LSERTMGVLWGHSSVNLVEPRSIALAAAFLRRLAGDQVSVSITLGPPQPAELLFLVRLPRAMVSLAPWRREAIAHFPALPDTSFSVQ